MTEDEVLSGAIDVFNRSVDGSSAGGSTAGQQNAPGVLDNTASGTTGNSGSGQAGTGADGDQQQGSAQPGQAGGGVAGTDTDNSASGTGTGGVPARRIIVVEGNGSSGTMTEQERVETLDRELDDSMGVFDGVILSRRQEVIARTNETGAGQKSGTGDGTDGISNADGSVSPPLLTEGGNGNTGGSPTTAGNGRLPDASPDNRQGDYANSGAGNANVPADLSDGSDDDIVARQLREAAMQEKDPVLREKLWDEYRKYKQGIQAKK